MDLGSFHNFILVPTLSAVGLGNVQAYVLLLGTGIIESDLSYFEQKGPGKAMGFFQMEEKTYQDLLRYLNRYDNAKLKERCLAASFYDAWPPSEAMVHNLRWATLMCRLKYYMQPEKLPEWDDAKGMAAYHKRYYNTLGGKADIDKSEKVFESLINIYPNISS
jgi:hypothetical protein